MKGDPISYARRGDGFVAIRLDGSCYDEIPRATARGCCAVTCPDDEFHPYNRMGEGGFERTWLRPAVRLVLGG